MIFVKQKLVLMPSILIMNLSVTLTTTLRIIYIPGASTKLSDNRSAIKSQETCLFELGRALPDCC